MKPYHFLIFFLSTAFSLYGAHLSTETRLKEDYKIQTFILPVNWSSSVKYNLVVSIPEPFVPVQPYSSFSSKDKTTLEFIPENETVDNWTSIITLHKFLGKKIPAEKLVQQFKNMFVLQSEKPKFWKEEIQNNSDYTQASFGLSYLIKEKPEEIGISYYSGPYDLVGVQYTIRHSDQISQEEAIKRIETFLQSFQLTNHTPED